MSKDYTLKFKKEKNSFFGGIKNFFKKNKAIISSSLILVGSIVAGIAFFSINPFVASAILGLGIGVAGFNLTAAQHFKNSYQNNSSVIFLEAKKESLVSKENSLRLRDAVLDQMKTGVGNSSLTITEQYVVSQKLKLIDQKEIIADIYDLYSNRYDYTQVEFEKKWDALDSKYKKINQEYKIEREQHQDQIKKPSNRISTSAQQKHSPELSVSSDSVNSTQSSSRESSLVSIKTHSFNVSDDSNNLSRVKPLNRRNSSPETHTLKKSF